MGQAASDFLSVTKSATLDRRAWAMMRKHLFPGETRAQLIARDGEYAVKRLEQSVMTMIRRAMSDSGGGQLWVRQLDPSAKLDMANIVNRYSDIAQMIVRGEQPTGHFVSRGSYSERAVRIAWVHDPAPRGS